MSLIAHVRPGDSGPQPGRMCVRMLHGLGDTIYLRACVMGAPEDTVLWLPTPWPQLFADLDPWRVRLVRTRSSLRHAGRNAKRHTTIPQIERGDVLPRALQHEIKPTYPPAGQAMHCSIVEQLSEAFGWAPAPMSLPDFRKAADGLVKTGGRPLAIVRPVTLRREYPDRSRNCDPAYVYRAAERLMDTHCLVRIADVGNAIEQALGVMPPAHVAFDQGELTVEQMLGLVQSADLVVGPVGWIVPACLASRTRAFVILGGCLGRNRPDVIGDAPWMGWARPDEPCNCGSMNHDCNKRISDFDDQFERFLQQAADDAGLCDGPESDEHRNG